MDEKRRRKHNSKARQHLDELLHEALKQTFPASDPIAIAVEPSNPEKEKEKDKDG